MKLVLNNSSTGIATLSNLTVNKGFTLFELLVSLIVSATLIMVAVPDLQRFYHNYRLRSLAIELSGFFTQARATARKQRQPLWIRFKEHKRTDGSSKWQLALYNAANEAEAVKLDSIEGTGSYLKPSWESMKLDGRNGRVLVSGHLLFWYGNSNKISLKLITHNITGRVRICAPGQEFYEYPQC